MRLLVNDCAMSSDGLNFCFVDLNNLFMGIGTKHKYNEIKSRFYIFAQLTLWLKSKKDVLLQM